MFFSRKTVIVALLLTAVAMPVSAGPVWQLDSLFEPARLVWQSLVSIFESPDLDSTEVEPSALTEEALGWIDPAGAQGDSPAPEVSEDGGDESGLADFHGWVDPAGVGGDGDGS